MVRFCILGVGVILAMALTVFSSPLAEDKLALPTLNEDTLAPLKAYLAEHGQSPEKYIAGKFDDHDVVFVGEIHYVKHDAELIQRLIPLLHARGVNTLVTEFARREEQPLIDRLLSADEYNEALAREIQFCEGPDWAFQEYLDIYKAAWEVNRSVSEGEEPFRILGGNNSPDWSVIQTAADRNDPEKVRAVWHGESEEDWARVILDEVEAGRKVLVYSGMHHAFSEFKHPIINMQTNEVINYEDRRMGSYVYNAIGKRAITIGLHTPWPGPQWQSDAAYPVGGTIDALMKHLGPEHYPVGFDVVGTPFGELTSDDHLYARGYDTWNLAMYCDGYIFTKPISQYEGSTVVKDFVNEHNLERAQRMVASPGLRKGIAMQFQMSAARAANVKWKYRRFH